MAIKYGPRMSLLLSRHLSLEGFSAQNTLYCKNATGCLDLTMTMLTYTDGIEYHYTAGSKAEGTETTESDQDAMVSNRGIRVTNKDEKAASTDEDIMFVKETDPVNPSYVRLTPIVFLTQQLIILF